MGLTPKTKVMVRKKAPLGDPIEIFLRGYELTLRLDDANKITVAPEEYEPYLRPRRQPKLRQKHTFQLSDRQQSARRQLSRRHSSKRAALNCKDVTVIDLPGIYSLSPYTSEEIVTRDLLLRSKPDIIINVIDATNIERSLYLSLQLIELNTPMIMALNMMDELTASGGSIDIKKIEDRLTVPVVPITANSGLRR